MIEKCILTIMILQLAIIDCCAVSGIIWLKQKQEFVQLFSIPQFAALQKENLAKRERISDMKNEIIRVAYYEEKNMVMFYDNDTKVSGICGEVWYLLADYLNFTFIPVKTTNRDFGERLKNGSYSGIIGMLMRNEVQAIMRTGYFISRMDILDYTTALWKSQFHIYVQPELQIDNTWVFALFCPTTWYSITFLFIILSFVGYFLQKLPINYKLEKKNSVKFSLSDHFFHSFAMMCAQGYIPDAFYNKFKILSISKSIFAWLVLLVYSSHLIYCMTIRETMLPFKDVDTLFANTKKILLTFRGSIIYYYLHDKYGKNASDKNLLERIQFIDIAEDMHNIICDNMKKYAMYEIDDRFMALNRKGCPLTAIGDYNETYISFGLQKHYPYKKNIDYALIKFIEVGLMDALQDRWMNIKLEDIEEIQFKMIDLHQVYLIFLILCWGTLISFVILILENIIYYYEIKNVLHRRM